MVSGVLLQILYQSLTQFVWNLGVGKFLVAPVS